jgi:hypothetical protein
VREKRKILKSYVVDGTDRLLEPHGRYRPDSCDRYRLRPLGPSRQTLWSVLTRVGLVPTVRWSEKAPTETSLRPPLEHGIGKTYELKLYAIWIK